MKISTLIYRALPAESAFYRSISSLTPLQGANNHPISSLTPLASHIHVRLERESLLDVTLVFIPQTYSSKFKNVLIKKLWPTSSDIPYRGKFSLGCSGLENLFSWSFYFRCAA